jgi:hydrogenase-1 operon protein HyaF
VSSVAACPVGRTTGMAFAVLAEVAQLLKALAEDGSSSAIDLRSLPLTDADTQQLEDLLGRGEVHAELEIAGATEVWETHYAGAWWVRHRGARGEISSEELAICRVPDILLSHPSDIRDAAQRIAAELENHSAQIEEASHG